MTKIILVMMLLALIGCGLMVLVIGVSIWVQL